MTSAKIILDSISPEGQRITTMQVKFHRFVLAEFNTHRAFSRNFSSSRAIPTKKLLEQVRTNPAIPVWWGKNQAGMQAPEELGLDEKSLARIGWNTSAHKAADMAEAMLEIGVHKQIVNRLIEPFLYVEGIVTSTDWQNFFDLRCHPDAQPEIQALAYCMRDALNASTPAQLKYGDWHLPYLTEEERQEFKLLSCPLSMGGHGGPISEDIPAKISAARCCRVSYLKHDGTTPDAEEDLALFDRLAGGVPIHASPLEHQARCVEPINFHRSLGRNFSWWHQFRALYETGQV